jgi:hypothetical protein
VGETLLRERMLRKEKEEVKERKWRKKSEKEILENQT